jgi:recombination protein RecA
VRVKVVKNKVAPPFKQAEFDIMFGRGISKSGSILDLAVDTGLVSKTGTWFTYGDLRLGQGRENAKSYLEEHPETMTELENRIRGTWETTTVDPVTVGAGAGANGADDDE